MSNSKKGIRRLDRLISVLLDIAENPDQDSRTRLDATKQALVAMGQNRVGKKKDPKARAVEKMLGNRPQPNPNPFVKKVDTSAVTDDTDTNTSE